MKSDIGGAGRTRRQLLKETAVLGGLAVAAPILAACQPSGSGQTSASASAVARRGGSLIIGGDAIGDNYDPGVALQGRAHYWVVGAMFETLYSSRDYKNPAPALATSYTVSSDLLTYTFKLRQGVKFHDGTPFDASAVEFQYMSFLDKTHPFYDELAIQARAALTGVVSVKAVDASTVQIVRSSPDNAFINQISIPWVGIQSPTAIKKYGVKDIGRYPVGTGPFVFEKGEKNNQASVTANKDYWAGLPPLDRIVVRAISDPQAMTASLLSGEVDVAPLFVDFKDLDTLRANPKLSVSINPAAITGYVGVNAQHPALKDVRVRQALAYAVNRQRIIDTIFFGNAEIPAGLTSSSVFAYAPQFKDYFKYDPEKAKSLLKDAGAAPEFAIICRPDSYWPRMAELLQNDFNAVGFKTTIQKVDAASFFPTVGTGQQAVFVIDGANGTSDPEDIYFALFGCNNPRSKRWGYCDPTFDQLLTQQAGEANADKRKQMIWDMQKNLLDAVSQIYLYYGKFPFVVNKRVQNFPMPPVPWIYFNDISVTS